MYIYIRWQKATVFQVKIKKQALKKQTKLLHSYSQKVDHINWHSDQSHTNCFIDDFFVDQGFEQQFCVWLIFFQMCADPQLFFWKPLVEEPMETQIRDTSNLIIEEASETVDQTQVVCVLLINVHSFWYLSL